MSALPRRGLLLASAGGLLALRWRPVQAQTQTRALDEPLQQALRQYAAGQPLREGRITLDIAPLIDNGNAVPITVRVDAPVEQVAEIAVFNERNPQRDVVRARFTPACGRAQLSTRIRLATTQHLVALARMTDGSVWQQQVHVVVTLAACIEGDVPGAGG